MPRLCLGHLGALGAAEFAVEFIRGEPVVVLEGRVSKGRESMERIQARCFHPDPLQSHILPLGGFFNIR